MSLLVFALLAVGVSAGWDADGFPNPMNDPVACGRNVKGWLCDPDKLVSTESQDVIQGHIMTINQGQKTECDGAAAGWQVAVAVLKRIEGYGDAARKTAKFAHKVHDQWGVGDACGNGVLLVVSVDDRQMYVSSGRGALPHLSSGRVDGIRERMAPNLRAGNYGAALEQAVVEIGMYLSEAKGAEPEGSWWPLAAIGSMVAGIFGYSAWSSRREQRTFKFVQAKLRQMQQDLQDAKADKYLSTTCPICLDEFEPPAPGGSPSGELSGVATQPSESDVLLGRDGSTGASSSKAAESEPLQAPLRQAAKGPEKGDAPAKRVKSPFLLSCGHTFCEPCIMKWLDDHAACPVCRKPADGSAAPDAPRPSARPPPADGAQPPQRPTSPSAPTSCQQRYGVRYTGRPYLGQGMYLDEFAFRMAMMRRRYPEYITPAMEHDMVSQAASDGNINWAQHRDFLTRNPELRAERARMGASGSSMSFGGGRSGGGSGGGW